MERRVPGILTLITRLRRAVSLALPAAALAAAVAGAQTYREAPMLAAMVRAGDLPPVAERLPSNPLVVEPVDAIGVYGGTLRMADPSDWMSIGLRVRQTGLFRYDQSASRFEADLAAGYAWSDDYRTLTLMLRDGLRWSDGAPFTTADMMFKWNDYVAGKAPHRSGYPFWGERATWEPLDDTTLRITWAAPNPAVMDAFGRTHYSGDNSLFLPAHYLKQFHGDFSDGAAALAAELGYAHWRPLFNDRRAQGYDQSAVTIGRPYVDMHVPEVVEGNRVLLVRNPYYHHVDTAGNQLPYVDRLEVTHVPKRLYDLKVMAGEVDFAALHTAPGNLPAYRAGETRGGYRTVTAQSIRPAALALYVNHNVEDPVLHGLFNDRDFRVALSIALDRGRMNETVFFGLGDPHPATPLYTMEFFDQRWYNDHLAHDPDRANRLLDAAGLSRRDGAGFRVRPDDGRRLSLAIEIEEPDGVEKAICELIADDWRQVGIAGACQAIDGALLSERLDANRTAISARYLGRGTMRGRNRPDQFAFERCSANHWGRQWCFWFASGGAAGVEPPAEIKALNERWRAFKQAAAGTPQAVALGKAYFAVFADELPIIPTIGLAPHPVIIHDRLRNVPTDNVFWGSSTNFYAPYKPEQWYIAE